MIQEHAMTTASLSALLPQSQPTALPLARRLRRNQFLHFRHPRRLCVRAESGTLWITVDGEPDDIELHAGASRVFDGGAPVIVGVLGGTAVVTATQRPALGWRERLRQLLARAPSVAGV
jgi:hypothetical protein